MDGGSETTLIPRALVSPDLRLTQSNLRINGLSGPEKVLGYFLADIEISRYIFTDIRVYVMNSEIPIILGNNLLKHDTIKRLTYDRDHSIIRFDIRGGLSTEAKMANRSQILNEFTSLVSEIPRSVKLDYLTEIKQVHLDADLPDNERNDIIDILYDYVWKYL